jgi:hypothetical protein
MCLTELNYPSLDKLLLKRRSDFIKRKLPFLQDDDPLKLALELCRSANTNVFKILQKAIDLDRDPVQQDIASRKYALEQKCATSSKRHFYIDINPQCSVHPIYHMYRTYVPEYLRVMFTRLRLVSHNLRIETGRWARLERARRTCTCDNHHVQTEQHALFECPLTEHLREINNYWDFEMLFNDEDYVRVCRFIYTVINIFKA